MPVQGQDQQDRGSTPSASRRRRSRTDGRRALAQTATRLDADGAVEFDERRAKMERLRAEGIDPYPPVSLWATRTRIADVLAAHDPATLERRRASASCATRSPAA